MTIPIPNRRRKRIPRVWYKPPLTLHRFEGIVRYSAQGYFKPSHLFFSPLAIVARLTFTAEFLSSEAMTRSRPRRNSPVLQQVRPTAPRRIRVLQLLRRPAGRHAPGGRRPGRPGPARGPRRAVQPRGRGRPPRRSASRPATPMPTTLPSMNALNTQPYRRSPPRSRAATGITVTTASASDATKVTVRTRPTVSARAWGAQSPRSRPSPTRRSLLPLHPEPMSSGRHEIQPGTGQHYGTLVRRLSMGRRPRQCPTLGPGR